MVALPAKTRIILYQEGPWSSYQQIPGWSLPGRAKVVVPGRAKVVLPGKTRMVFTRKS
jgi:hypothetical protein